MLLFAARFNSPAERFRIAMTVATLASTPRLLMCPPQHFAVTYSINPWMDPAKWADDGTALQARAAQQWMALHAALLEAGAMIETVPPLEGAPDLVFTANAAVVLDGKALLARFRHPERQIEEPVFAAALPRARGARLDRDVIELPAGIALEGAGDCLWDRKRGLFWMGCGFRSDEAAAREVEAAFGVPCLPLKLSEASYYHLDTAMCALPCGGVIYYPARVHAGRARGDPRACCAGRPHRALVGGRCALCRQRRRGRPQHRAVVGSAALRRTLEERGYRLIETPLDAFQRSGGSACCLTLRLDHRSQAAAGAASRKLARRALFIGAAGVARLLLHVVVDAHDALDAQRPHAGFAADLAILLLDQLARRLVAVDAAEDVGRHAPVGALRAVLVIDVEHDVFGPGRRFACHGSCSLNVRKPPAAARKLAPRSADCKHCHRVFCKASLTLVERI